MKGDKGRYLQKIFFFFASTIAFYPLGIVEMTKEISDKCVYIYVCVCVCVCIYMYARTLLCPTVSEKVNMISPLSLLSPCPPGEVTNR